ncbi:MAG: hypothetical protein JW941_03740, partial [Candidatus Coatesbacteria bacterium]|nr:hypothetical protein [Candidatus Coatesbacteria bacterium]
MTGDKGVMTALLVRTPGRDDSRAWWPTARCRLISSRHAPPFNLLLVAAKLSLAGFRCKLADYEAEGLEWGALQSDLVKHRPEIVVFDSSLPSLGKDLAAVREAKKLNPDSIAILCGRDLLFEEAGIHWEAPELDGIISDPCRFASPGRVNKIAAALNLLQSRKEDHKLTIGSFKRAGVLDINNTLSPVWEILKRSC